MSRRAVSVALLSLLATGAACTAYKRRADLPTYDPALYAAATAPTPSPSPPLAWAQGSEYAIVVRKHERTLSLYHWAEQQEVYPIVLGIAPDGPKTYRGDLRTPE